MIKRNGRQMARLVAAIAAGVTVQALAAETTRLEPVTVIGTRSERPVSEVPAAIDVVEPSENSMGVNLSESLPAIPGVVARDRQNYAQDTQISIRGFGARSTFGIRGLRLYLDDIPATQPDGQGQVSHFNLATADRIEVLRGPFSALYGNSSGGVIALYTEDGSPTPEVSFGSAYGSDNAWRASLGTRGTLGKADYNLGYTRFHTDGFRDHSEARRESLNGKLNYDFGTAGKLTLLVNAFDSPDVQDPLGLTRAQFEADPEQATAVATQFNTRKSVDQAQAGAIYQLKLGEGHSLRFLGYGGRRGVEQFLAIGTGPQGSPRHSGGVVDLDNDYSGVDARWSWRSQLAARPFELVAGLSYDQLSQHRRGYENFVGAQAGVRGALRRDEDNDVDSFDQYLQASWDFAEQWSATAGLRHSRVAFDSQDAYITATNPDDSGEVDYSATTPVAGLMYKPSAALHFYAAYGRGFETPTIAELAYRPDGGAGLNFGLDAARTTNTEIGAKLRLSPRLQAQLALFNADSKDELAVATNSGGRSTFFNVGRTRRRGIETALQAQLAPKLQAQLAYTFLDAQVREAYLACSGTPCTTPATPVPAGSNLPGVPQGYLFASLRWGAEQGWQAWVDGRYVDSVPVNDANSESAPSYKLADAGVGYGLALAH
ncbi:MAG TPA: TonB-dependent receptor, partial [Solimonas sp.]|nr:TonB-dependent receptor [Solimonas sp.]